MKIAFLGHNNFSDYFKIGGFESLTRRLAFYLSSRGHFVDYFIYNAESAKEMEVFPNLKLKYFQSFEDCSDALFQSYDHIFKIWLNRRERIRYILFSKRIHYLTKARCHSIILNWSDSIFKQKLILLEAMMSSHDGRIICVSPRQYRKIKTWSKRAYFLYPPVPDEYFLKPEEKSKNEKIKVAFLGMITPDKYIEEIIELFKDLRRDPRFDCIIHAIHDSRNKRSFEIHQWLSRQKEVKYIQEDIQKYSPEGEKKVISLLRETDIFIQPFRRLVNTLDTPLLLLEAMASLCAVVTTPTGSVPGIYGKSPFIISRDHFLEEARILLKNITYQRILKERERIFKRNGELNFALSSMGPALDELLR
ncbi:MAG: glycosyltransferase [Acidobacteriota bacterium]